VSWPDLHAVDARWGIHLTMSRAGSDGDKDDKGLTLLIGSFRSLDDFAAASRDLDAGFSAAPARSSRLETLLKPASRSRRLTSRMT
jgi:hypothetical protein